MTDRINAMCFRCGTEQEVDDDTFIGACPHCLSQAVVSLRLACDIINDLYLKGLLQREQLQEYE